MKKALICALGLMLTAATVASAQCLTLKKKYATIPAGESVSNINKPNGNMYRLREEIQEADLPLIPEVKNSDTEMIMIISDAVPGGWWALYRNTLGADTYKFIAVFYNMDKTVNSVVDLCAVSNTYNCEVQDMRWDHYTGCLMFNMACPSYASSIGGKGSKLFCYDLDNQEMKWSTPYLTSNDIFTFNSDYVFCSYGFTGEKDYVFMIDKETGKVLSKMPTTKKVEYMELQQKNDKEYLYCVDYNGSLYVYDINKTTPPAVKAPAKPAAKPAARPAAKSATRR